MNAEKLLKIVNRAISYLNDKDDSYGMTPVDMMRKNGIKTADGLAILNNTTGACLEEMRCYLLDEIAAEAARKSGTSSIRSEVKKLAKEFYKKNAETRPRFAYAWHDEEADKYYMCNNYMLLVGESPDGMNLIPDAVKEREESFNYKRFIPNKDTMKTMTLPAIGKLSAYNKQRKAVKDGKKRNAVIISDGDVKLKLDALWLESLMKITGATEIYYKDYMHAFYFEGNGYAGVLMPHQIEEGDKPTDFDNI